MDARVAVAEAVAAATGPPKLPRREKDLCNFTLLCPFESSLPLCGDKNPSGLVSVAIIAQSLSPQLIRAHRSSKEITREGLFSQQRT